MQTEDLRLTFSNFTSAHLFPSNKLNKFRYHLNSPLEFGKEKWEVALYEINFPKSMFKVAEETTFMLSTYGILLSAPKTTPLSYKSLNRNYNSSRQFSIRHEVWSYEIPVVVRRNILVSLKPKSYISIEAALLHLNQVISNAQKSDCEKKKEQDLIFEPFRVDKIWNVATNQNKNVVIFENNIESEKQGIRCEFQILSGLEFWKLLGFRSLELNKFYDFPLVSQTPSNLKLVQPSMFVYAPNLIEYQLVGDTLSPLLQFVPIDIKSKREFQTFRVRKLVYNKVASGYISTIDIDIRNFKGEEIEFTSGEIVITLLFRKCL